MLLDDLARSQEVGIAPCFDRRVVDGREVFVEEKPRLVIRRDFVAFCVAFLFCVGVGGGGHTYRALSAVALGLFLLWFWGFFFCGFGAFSLSALFLLGLGFVFWVFGEQVGDEESDFQRLFCVEPWVAVGVIAVSEVFFFERSCASDALGDRVASHL